ncbi:MAG: pyruvate, phosphate dikinase [Paenibacillus sp.]|nr:pyruvate, phosphate dikinase [Paenibacillus sp.]
MELDWVKRFEEGHAGEKHLLGGKGANLAEMTRVGLPVPPGFTITTQACRAYFEEDSRLPKGLMDQVNDALKDVEAAQDKGFGDAANPLLVSVRSGSVNSMPGMMDTILNVGLNDLTVEGLARLTNNPRFAYDCYRRLVQMFGNVVFGIDGMQFERLLHDLKRSIAIERDSEISAESWQTLIEQYKVLIKRQARIEFPQKVQDQLTMAVESVFRSWDNPRAKVYRKVHQIPDIQGTAVNIQAMVFGNRGEDCGTGVVFTRDPSTGEKVLYGEFLTNAQGEDVVAGSRTPRAIKELEDEMPEVFRQLTETAERLEMHYKDMQDIEFTVELGKLYILQTRGGKRSAQAAMKIGVDLVAEGVLAPAEAVRRVDASHLDQLLHPTIHSDADLHVLAVGLPASPGAASGLAVFDADTAEEWAQAGRRVVLVRAETTPEDIHGVLAAEGVLTSRGGMTSHAAVVARGMGKPCVCGCEVLRIDTELGTLSVGDIVVRQGDSVTIDGSTGRVILGTVPLREAEMTAELRQLLSWADEIRTLKVLANADNPEDARKAREFGAEGIGLCRTEHMFLLPERLPIVQSMILADTLEGRMEALSKLLPMQRNDFAGLFRAMDGLPVSIRLLDPPLHEFLPNLEELKQRLEQVGRAEGGSGSSSASAGVAVVDTQTDTRPELERLIRKVKSLHEVNPMLGQRGCRLGILYPEIYEMQVEAVFLAVKDGLQEGLQVIPEIMIPLVGHVNELKLLREMVDHTAARILNEDTAQCAYKVGTMIEVPRAALTAGQIAEYADFFSFGTNDLTQMTYGYSRDDAEGKFLTAYVDRKVLEHNPFQVLDRDGVGQLIDWAVVKGRAVKPALKTGVCGEHGGDRQSIGFCHEAGLDYVSCSPFRILLARIAAAQAKLEADEKV